MSNPRCRRCGLDLAAHARGPWCTAFCQQQSELAERESSGSAAGDSDGARAAVDEARARILDRVKRQAGAR
jgi:hypothetical protein